MAAKLIPILISDLRYEAKPDKVQVITIDEFYYLRKHRRRDELIQRLSWSRYRELQGQHERRDFRQWYDQQIMNKYNVGPDFRLNRYFMEQVRPTL